MLIGQRILLAVIVLPLVVASVAAQGVTIDDLRAKYPPNVEGLDPGFHWAPDLSRETVTPERARVPIHTDWPEVAGLGASPVTFGVPFADESLQSAENARLVAADGTPVPADLRTTATWWREDGPVRWLLVSATLERGTDYFIEYGTDVAAYEASGMAIEETDDAIMIDTGPMQTTISKSRATILDSVTVNGEAIVTPEDAAANLPTIVDGESVEYSASARDMQVTFTRRGPMEAVVRREGWYTSDAGEQLCQFITYTWFAAGSASVRHDHTMVVGFDTTRNTIRDIRLAIPVSGGVAAATLALDDRQDRPMSFAAGALPVRAVQTDVDRCIITDASGEGMDDTRVAGWAGADRADGAGAFVCVRDLWEQYPMELEVTGDALVAHLWAAHDAPVLDYAPSAVMGDRYPGGQVFWRDFYRDGLDSWAKAYGSAKTHNLHFGFFGTDSPSRAGALAAARAFDRPVLAYADPRYAADTWAFGRVRHRDPQQFPEIEALQDAFTHRKYWLRDRLGNYGWIDFGDVNYNIGNATDPDEITYSHCRHWAQMFYGGPNTHPLQFMRSGDRDAWDFHRVNTRHILDLDIAHLDSNETHDFRYPKEKGGCCNWAASPAASTWSARSWTSSTTTTTMTPGPTAGPTPVSPEPFDRTTLSKTVH